MRYLIIVLALTVPVAVDAQEQTDRNCMEDRGDGKSVIDRSVVRVVTKGGRGTAFLVHKSSGFGYFLTADHVLAIPEDIRIRTCGEEDDADDPQIYDVEVHARAEDPEISDVAVLRAKMADTYSTTADPLRLSSYYAEPMEVVAWYAGYPMIKAQDGKSHEQLVVPAYRSPAQWSPTHAEQKWGLYTSAAPPSALKGFSGSPLLRRGKDGEPEVIGVIVSTPSVEQLSSDDLVSRYNISEQEAAQLAMSSTAASDLDPMDRKLFDFIENDSCFNSYRNAIESSNSYALQQTSRSCFGGSQPAISAARLINWLSTQPPELKSILYKNREAIKDSYKRIGGRHLSQQISVLIKQSESLSTISSSDIAAIDEARNIARGYYKNPRQADKSILISASDMVKKPLELASRRYNFSQNRVFFGFAFVDAYRWLHESDSGDANIRRAYLTCAVSFAPNRSQTWNELAVHLQESGRPYGAGVAYGIASILPPYAGSDNGARANRDCRYLTRSESLCGSSFDPGMVIRGAALRSWFRSSIDIDDFDKFPSTELTETLARSVGECRSALTSTLQGPAGLP